MVIPPITDVPYKFALPTLNELLGFAEKLEVDCFGNMLNACNGIGLGKFHSNELPVIVSLLNLETEVKNEGTAQGFSLTFLPLAKISNII